MKFNCSSWYRCFQNFNTANPRQKDIVNKWFAEIEGLPITINNNFTVLDVSRWTWNNFCNRVRYLLMIFVKTLKLDCKQLWTLHAITILSMERHNKLLAKLTVGNIIYIKYLYIYYSTRRGPQQKYYGETLRLTMTNV